MQDLLIIIIMLIWLAGTMLRVYRQARFYQIEEYMSLRYSRWLFSEREHWLPSRPLAVIAVGLVLAFFNDSIPGQVSPLPYIISSIVTAIAVWPPSEGEIKRAFVRTQRATRMLGTASVAVAMCLLLLTLTARAVVPDSDRVIVAVLQAVGLLIFLLAPLWLILGNVLMTPVEAALRQRYIQQARSVLAAIQPKVVGITGSYGKTTTKGFLRDLLNGRYKTYATPKSYNTMMGVCLAINRDLTDDYSVEYFVCEMGAYVEGEIERIADLTHPEISIVVEVGPQHLERFGSLDNIATAKYEIIKALPPHGLGVFNWDNPYVRDMYECGYPQNRLAVSKDLSPGEVPEDGPRFVASDIVETLDGLQFTLTDIETGDQQAIETPVVGLHNVTNLLLAAAVCVYEGMSLRDVAFRARRLQPGDSRLERQTTAEGITIINDAYSANPVGVISALKVLGMHPDGRRLLITPGMVELGELHERENHKLGVAATNYATDIILVGEEQTRPIAEGVRSTDFPEDRLRVVSQLSEAVTWYQHNLSAGDVVLFLNDLPDTY